METLWLGILGVGVLLFLIAIGLHVGFACAVVGFAGLVIVIGWGPAARMMGFLVWGDIATWSLAVIPLFILMGYFAFYAGIASEIYWAARQWTGAIPGGLAMATVFGSAGLAACTGAGTAACAIMGKIAFPEMKKYGYDPKLTTGVIASGATLAILIPPSILLVVYGILTEQSITALLIAGFIPGIVSALIYALLISVLVRLRPGWGPPITGITWKERVVSLKGVWGFIVTVFIIVGGLYSGVFTPTEAGAVGCAATFCMALARRGVTMSNLSEGLRDTTRTTVMLLTIMMGVFIFARFVAHTGLTSALSEWLVGLQVSRYVIFAGIVVMYALLGCVMLGLAMVTFTIPIVFPAVVALGFDPIWFGIIIVKVVELSQITPPIGVNLYVIKGVAKDIPITEIIRGCAPFMIADLLTITLFVVFPDIVLFLPRVAGLLR